MTLHDYQLICPAYTLYSRGGVCERCKGHRYYNTVLGSCVKGSRLKSAICAAEAYFHAATGIFRNNVRFYLAPSHFIAEKVVEFGLNPRQVIYLPNFIDAASFGVEQATGNYYLFAGRLEKVKGVVTLLRAVSSSAVARSRELWIAGAGDERAALEAEAAALNLTNVRFLGQLPPAEMGRVLAGALFSVVPSEWYENAPLSILEAAARGKAVVVSDIGGIPELVRAGETGVVFPAGDAGALAGAIDGLLADPARTAEMGRKARAFMEEEFAPETHYRQLAAIYERALADERHT
jgi:glycosyltransferase involved in cell wall biosynthesis